MRERKGGKKQNVCACLRKYVVMTKQWTQHAKE